MRWITRYTVFALCLGLGSSTYHILAQKKSIPEQPVQAIEETPVSQTIAQPDSGLPEDEFSESIKFGPVEPMSGYANTTTVILRESADASAPITAKLKVSDYDMALILDGTRDFLRVRFTSNDGVNNGGHVRERDYEGWTTWASVVPNMTAIVLDAETGAVVSRVPLSEELSSVKFSPDSSRAIFSSGNDGVGRLAYEVQTSDYKLKRSLTSANDNFFGTLFYGPADGALYATFYPSANSGSGRISLLRIGEEGSSNTRTEFESDGNHPLIISPDGLTALRMREESGRDSVMDVIDLATLKVRNTFTLDNANSSPGRGDYILNRDGSELYIKQPDSGTIPVIDTRTGQQVRELQSQASTDGWAYFSQGNLIGDSVLLSVWIGGEDEMQGHSQKFWISNGRRMLAEPGIDFVAEAGGKRYAVNEDGTLLFKLNDNNRIQKRLVIDRPDRRKGADTGNGLSVFSLSASPDGKHLILLIGMAHGC